MREASRMKVLGLAIFTLLVLAACGGDSTPAPSVPAATHEYSWAEVTAASQFEGRDGAGAAVLDGKVFLLGGWRWAHSGGTNFVQTGTPGCCTTSEVWSSTDGVNWALETVAPWKFRHMAGWVTLNDKIFVVGGDDNSGSYETDVWSSPDGKNWVQLTESVPWAPRVLHYVIAFNNSLYVIGGQQLPEALVPAPNPYPTEPVDYADVWRSSDGVNWEQIGAVPHDIGAICGSVVFNNQIWVIGGGQYQDVNIPVAAQVYNEVWSSKDGINWTQHANAPWLARRYHSVTAFDGKLWVMAGTPTTDVDQSDVWSSEDGETWTELAGTPWVARHAATTFVLNNGLYITGGTDNGQIQHNDVWLLK